MVKRLFTVSAALSVAAAVLAQGGITDEMMSQIRQGWQGTPEELALRNAISANDINKLAVRQGVEAGYDFYFSDEVPSKGITDQQSSGRCWLFSGMNVLRAKMIEKYNLGPFQFSQNYIFFYDQLEKANLFLQGIIDTRDLPMDDRKVEWLFRHTINDGGQFTGVSDLITKYGVVPSNVMPETWAANHTSRMTMLLDLKLKEFGLELREMTGPEKKLPSMLEERKTQMLAFIYRFLVLNLGEPPTEFTWTMYDAEGRPVSTKTYTPKSFYDEYVGVDLKNDYVMLMNDPTREFYKVYEIEYDRHQYDGKNWLYINLPIEEIEAIAIASIKDSTMMYFSCDVGKFLDSQNGVLDVDFYDYGSLMGTEFGMDKRERILTGASGSSHAMTLMAVDLDEYGQAKKWKVENSWGMTGHEGHLVMTAEWFEEYMFRLVAEKKYVPENILKLLDTEPVMLPPWDPMFADEF
ncbi:MAG TPA: C1 family peptidase [Candidatus Coprenecus pullicola]|nr:C1 family peptidase [Candidatus Coprenecus pullicola]